LARGSPEKRASASSRSASSLLISDMRDNLLKENDSSPTCTRPPRSYRFHRLSRRLDRLMASQRVSYLNRATRWDSCSLRSCSPAWNETRGDRRLSRTARPTEATVLKTVEIQRCPYCAQDCH